MIERDLKLLKYLEKFRVLSRDQIGKLVCSDTANPSATATRICKRLARDGYLIIIPQWNDRQYLYMPCPPIIPKNSTHTRHFQAIADLYLELNCPEVFEVEPTFSDIYRPDVYCVLNGSPTIIEVQLSKKSRSIMQDKADRFMKSFYKQEHDAQTFWVYSSQTYDLKLEPSFTFYNGLVLSARMV